jgi:hypothetical protein
MMTTPQLQIVERAPFVARSRKADRDPLPGLIRRAGYAARGIGNPLPVIHDEKIVAWVRGDARNLDLVSWCPHPSRYSEIARCAFTNYDSIAAAVQAGTFYPMSFVKIATSSMVTSAWYDLWPVGGMPGAGTYPGSALTARKPNDTEAGTIQHGSDVSASVKHLSNIYAGSSAVATTLILYDRCLTYEACTISGGAQSFTNTGLSAGAWASPPRYCDANQAGVRVNVFGQTVTGATASIVSSLTYVDQSGNTAQTAPYSTTWASMMASLAAPTATLGARMSCPSNATNNTGLYLPLLGGDSGVRALEAFTTSAGNTGTLTFVGSYPIAVIPIAASVQTIMLDQVMQIAALPRIYDGAALSLFLLTQATTATTIAGGGTALWN